MQRILEGELTSHLGYEKQQVTDAENSRNGHTTKTVQTESGPVSVASAGDVNGDGFGDVIVAASLYTNGQANEGAALVYLGGFGDGLGAAFSLRSQQLQPGQGVPIAPGGRSTSVSSFDVAAAGRTILGRVRVKLEVEVKPNGSAFDALGLRRSSGWTDIGVAGDTSLLLPITGLSQDTAYHWRARVLYAPSQSSYSQTWSHWVWGGMAGFPSGTHLRTASGPVEVAGTSRSAGEATYLTLTLGRRVVQAECAHLPSRRARRIRRARGGRA